MSDLRKEPAWTPPRWLNAFMRGMLKTPGLQRLVGRGTALLTFTGRHSGREITTPVTYARDVDRVIVTCHFTRNWWRNLDDRPEVRLRLAGRDYAGRAHILEGEPAVDAFALLIEQVPMMAKFAEAEVVDGQVDRGDVRSALDFTKIIKVDLETARV